MHMYIFSWLLLMIFIFLVNISKQSMKVSSAIEDPSPERFILHDLRSSAMEKTPWNRTWGGINTEYGYGIWGDGAGSIYTLGDTTSFGAGREDLLLIKWNVDGIQQWNRTWGGSLHDAGIAVWGDGSGGIYTCGSTYSFSASGSALVLIKWNVSGSQQWNRTWGNSSSGYAVRSDGTGGIFTCGETHSIGAGNSDLALIKWNSTGDQQWNRTWGGPGYETGYGLWIDTTGNIYTCGTTRNSETGPANVILVKWDATGNQLWNRTWGTTLDENAMSLCGDTTGSIYTCGTVWNQNTTDILLTKWNMTGDILWNRTWDGASSAMGGSIWGDGTGAVYITGVVYQTIVVDGHVTDQADVVVVAWNAVTGNSSWYRTWGGPLDDYGTCLWGDGAGSLYICGITWNTGSGYIDILVLKMDISDPTAAITAIIIGVGVACGGAVAIGVVVVVRKKRHQWI